MAYQILQGSTHELPDIEAFIKTLNTLAQHPTPEARGLFAAGAELVVTRAPGRLEPDGRHDKRGRGGDPAEGDRSGGRPASGRSADRATDQIRTGDQPEDRQGARRENPAIYRATRRPGDRIVGP